MGESGDRGHKELLNVFFIEDDPSDVRLLREALAHCPEWCYLTTATNGAQALDMLFRRGKFNTFALPDMILLDLNLPILSGHEVLDAIKSNDTLAKIPVLIMSNSQNPEDINKAYSLGATCYIVKPHDFDHLSRICTSLRDFWYNKATLPRVLA